MTKVTRTLAMTGIAVAAGLTMGVGPASASPAAPATHAPAADRYTVKTKAIKFLRSERACKTEGYAGERRHKWDDFDCVRVVKGPKRGWVVLNAKWNIKTHGPIGHGGFGNKNDHHGSHH